MPLFELEQKGAFLDGNPAGIALVCTQLAAAAAVRDIETGKYVLSRDDFGRD